MVRFPAGRWALLAICGLLPGLAVDPLAGQDGPPSEPLAPFERFIGGAWHLDGSYQVFEWGLDRRVVHARSYAEIEGDTTLVSEGMWYWHPGEERIRGTVTAIRMPVSFFEYETRFDGDTTIHRLRSYGEMGGDYVEHWTLEGEDHYRWTLFAEAEQGRERLMTGLYERVPWNR